MTNLALLVIDVQKEYDSGGALEIPDLQKSLPFIERLVTAAREKSVDVIHIRHIESDSDAEEFCEGTKGVEFIDGFNPLEGEKLITKHVPGSFTGTDLHNYLQSKGVGTIIICGYCSFLCCDTTAREGCQMGYDVIYVDDAIGEFEIGDYTTEELHKYACTVQSESGFSTVVKTEEVIENFLS